MMQFRAGRSPIGLDVGPRSIAAVQATRLRSSWRLEAAAVVNRPAGAKPELDQDELLRLQDILYRQGFTGRNVVLAIPDNRVLSGTVELPPATSGAPVEQLAKAELARMHRKDPDTLETAAWKIPSPMRAGNFTYMMAVACAREDVERTLDNFEGAGLSPVAMDVRAWAMARALRPLSSVQSHAAAILDMSDAEAILSVVHSNVVVYERLMADSGVGGLANKLRTQLQLDPDIAQHVLESVGVSGGDGRELEGRVAEASALIREYFGGLMQEFRTALAYATHRYPGDVETVFIHGPGAAIPGLVRVMAEDLGVKVIVPGPADLASCPDSLRATCADPALTTAYGLAIHPEVAA